MAHPRKRLAPIPTGNFVKCLSGHIVVVECPTDAMRLNTTQHIALATIQRRGHGCVLWENQGAWAVIPTAILQNVLQLEEDYAVGKLRSRIRQPNEIGVIRWEQTEPISFRAAQAIFTGLKETKQFPKGTSPQETGPDRKPNQDKS